MGYCKNANRYNNSNNNSICAQNNTCTNMNLNGILNMNIGQRCTCEFEINNELNSRSGTLEQVGEDFLVLRSNNNQDRIMVCKTCDLKFITFTC